MRPKIRILLVDDNPALLECYTDILEQYGYLTLRASSGQEGLELARRERPELMLLDVVLPDLSGMEVCQQIKADPGSSDIFVILVSGQAFSPEDQARGLGVGADDYICKMTDLGEFVVRIRRNVLLQQTTSALRAREQLNRGILSTAMDGFWRYDSDGKIVDVNEAYCRISGYSAAELLTMHISDVEARESTPLKVAEHIALLVHNGADRFESQHRRKDGQIIDVEVSAGYLEFTDKYLFAFLRDISARKRAEAEIRASELRYRSLIEHSTAMIMVIRPNGEIIYANPTCYTTTGYSPGQVIGHSFFDFILPDDLPVVKAQWRRLLSSPMNATRRLTVQARHAGGSWHNHEGFAINRIEDPVIAGIMVDMYDITTRLKAQKILEEWPQHILEAQEAERKRVASDLHDGVNQLLITAKFRLLTVQQSIARLDAEAGRTVAESCEILGLTLEEIRRIIRNLRPLYLEELGLVATCDKWCRDFQARTGVLVEYQAAHFNQRLPAEVELQLFRIFQEAMHNVERHAQARRVRVIMTTRETLLTLKIQDDGRGFDAELLATSNSQSRGLGLTNIRQRAHSLNGTCEVHTAPDRGTEILVTVPFRPLA